jgi:hypothetical protein
MALFPFLKRSSGSVAKDKKAKPAAQTPKKRGPTPSFFRSLFETDDGVRDNISDEMDTVRRHQRLIGLIGWQGIATLVLTVLLLTAQPILRPYYKYRTLSPQNEQAALVPLDKPNMTERAMLSWAINSITEVMTLGFGDFDKQIMKQRHRFTSEGWDSFLKAMAKEDVREAFKSRQLVLTTVPSDVPVMVAQGIDYAGDGEYKWEIEMPIIMTYITNNNVKRQSKAVIRLTVVRVPGRDSIRGVAIKTWKIGS